MVSILVSILVSIIPYNHQPTRLLNQTSCAVSSSETKKYTQEPHEVIDEVIFRCFSPSKTPSGSERHFGGYSKTTRPGGLTHLSEENIGK